MRRVRYALRRDVDELLSSPRCIVAQPGIRERADEVLAVDHPLPRPNDRATGPRRSRWSIQGHDAATENHGDNQPTHRHGLLLASTPGVSHGGDRRSRIRWA